MASSTNPRSCPACQHPRDSQRRMTAASTTLRALVEESRKGCVPCSIFSAAAFKLGDQSEISLEHDWDFPITLYFNMRYLGESLTMKIFRLGTSISFFCLKQTPWLQRTLPDLHLACKIPGSTSSPASIEWVKGQLQTCFDSHSPCARPNPRSSPAPTRLLDLRTFENGHVRLVDAPQAVERYACLSYCWGKKPFLRTTPHNIESHRRGINLTELPIAFVDAMYTARQLDIFFLWADSLCIIQDDSDDWSRESSQMASIYQNAHIVLSATMLANPHSSLFSTCHPDFYAQKVDIPVSEAQGEIFFRRSFSHISHDEADQLALPTLKRGWIFQERILATRVLHFGPQELMWECLEHSACQCTVEPKITSRDTAAPLLSQMSISHGGMQLKSSFNLQNWKHWDEATLCLCWHKLVEQYSNLSLTHASDIFPAISGVSKQFQSALGCKGLAGLWEKTILKDLLWHVGSSVDDSDGMWKRPEAWRAPTWSWASVQCPVEFIDTVHGFEPCCTVQDVFCSPAAIDPLGEVSDAHVVLQGNLIPMKLTYPPFGFKSQISGQNFHPFNLFILEDLGKPVRNIWADVKTHIEGSDYLASGTEVYILSVGFKTRSRAIECLILKRVSEVRESCTATYERIGLLELPRAPSDGLDDWMRLDRRTHTIKII